MKLLLDENISFKLVNRLQDVFPGIKHISDFQLNSIEDKIIFQFAKENGFAIVTFDEDYFTLSVLNTFPPKIIWLRTGNLSTKELEEILKVKKLVIDKFLEDVEPDAYGCLEID
jgi:predicted nuclease of predicted toxin-antitoxin system